MRGSESALIASIALLVLVSRAPGSSRARPILPADLPLSSAGPDSFVAEFQTTKGAFIMKARRAWSPLGSDRLYHLVRAGYFDGLTIYRVGPTVSVQGGRVVQFGQSGDTAVARAWDKAGFADEPVVRLHRRGSVNFARGGPDTRTVEIAITTNAAAPLDTVHYLGVVGFPSVAEVERGLEVLDRLNGQYGNAPIENDSLSILGGAYLERVFPGLDRIRRARVTKEWGRPAPDPDSVQVLGATIELVRVNAGTFRMGTDSMVTGPDGWTNDVERPVHRVTLTRAFWMGRYPITQRQWQAVMGRNPSYCASAGPTAPVEQVSWNDCQAFLAKANAGQSRWTLRLPTEAEWEYACRAGTTAETYGPLDRIAWYRGNNSGQTHPVGQKEPNAFGLYDMLGDVWQWCSDWFAPYPDSAVTDPRGPEAGERRIMRGGCYYCDAIHCRAARRNRDPQDHLSRSIGLRIVAELRSEPSHPR